MKQTERILGVLIVILMTCRLFFTYPYSALLLTLLMLVLSMLYFIFSFGLLNRIRFRNLLKKESYVGLSTLRIIGTTLTGFVLSSVVLYSLFKFQNWPYGNEALRIALLTLLIILFIVVIKFAISKNSFYSFFLVRLCIMGVIASSLYLIPYENILEMKYRNFPEFIDAEKKLMKDPTNKELERIADQERLKMDLSK
ncbi:MAG: hypothetical protein KBT58_12605 [Bizionia sp.]|nr:hypothetical protein [Bizionia sp.]